MHRLHELTVEECVELLTAGVVGRAAICTPTGPHVVPVNYTVDGDSIVVRTTPYSVLGTYSWAGEVAFEVDDFDTEAHAGWSVVVHGRCEMVDDIGQIARIHWRHDPSPWAPGPRSLYLRLRWREVTGRRIG